MFTSVGPWLNAWVRRVRRDKLPLMKDVVQSRLRAPIRSDMSPKPRHRRGVCSVHLPGDAEKFRADGLAAMPRIDGAGGYRRLQSTLPVGNVQGLLRLSAPHTLPAVYGLSRYQNSVLLRLDF